MKSDVGHGVGLPAPANLPPSRAGAPGSQWIKNDHLLQVTLRPGAARSSSGLCASSEGFEDNSVGGADVAVRKFS